MIPIIIKKIQTNDVFDLIAHEIISKKCQTDRHIVRELYVRTTYYKRKI
jgi:hypothetical protein